MLFEKWKLVYSIPITTISINRTMSTVVLHSFTFSLSSFSHLCHLFVVCAGGKGGGVAYCVRKYGAVAGRLCLSPCNVPGQFFFASCD